MLYSSTCAAPKYCITYMYRKNRLNFARDSAVCTPSHASVALPRYLCSWKPNLCYIFSTNKLIMNNCSDCILFLFQNDRIQYMFVYIFRTPSDIIKTRCLYKHERSRKSHIYRWQCHTKHIETHSGIIVKWAHSNWGVCVHS